MTMSEFKRRIKPYNVSFNYGFDHLGPLPTQHTKCQCCGETWSIDNICDYITKSDTCLSSNLKHTIPEAEYKRVAHALSFRFIVNDAQPTQLAETLNRITGSSWSVHYEDDNPENKISHYNFLKYYHKACYANFLSKKVATEFIEALRSAGIGIYGMIRTKNKYGSEAYNGPWFIFDTSIGHLRLGWRKSVIEISYAAIDNQYISKTERTAGPGYEHICDSSQLTEALIKFKAHLNARGVASNSIPDMVFNS
jgi:hypothetical protein